MPASSQPKPDVSWKQRASRSRPSIKSATHYELWGRAAGRCEFRGCNEVVYRDGLTQGASNLSTVAHIVAWTPEGPRGHPTRSAELATDIGNLMLTCKKHGKYIDDANRVEEYPEALLIEFKKEHEKRVQLLTDITEEAQTRVVLLQAPVDGRDVKINERHAHQALLPLYPAEEHADLFDLSGLGITADAPGFYPALATSLDAKTTDLLRRRGSDKVRSLAVFAIAPIPLLVHFGHRLGDLVSVELFQHHRGKKNPWAWRGEEELDLFYETIIPALTPEDHRGGHTDPPTPVVSVSISGYVEPSTIRPHVDGPSVHYQINLPGVENGDQSGRDALPTRARLEAFGIEFRRVLDAVRARHGHDQTVHLFLAVPAPVAIEIGRNVKHVDPPFLIYDYQKAAKGYSPALVINENAP